MSEKHKRGVWRRRERSLTAGVILWAAIVSATLTLRPESVVEWLVVTHPLQIAGVLLVSIGLCGGFADAVHLAVKQWSEPNETELTEVPWDQ